MGKARITIFQLADRVYPIAPPAPNRIVPLTLVHAAYPVVRERVDAYVCVENLHIAVRMAFAIYLAPKDAEREFVAGSDEIVVEGNGRTTEAVLYAGPVTFPRAGSYAFDLIANGKRVKTQGMKFGVDRR